MEITLTEDQKQKLEEQHKTERDSRICDRIKAVLLASEDWTQKQIAQAKRMNQGYLMEEATQSGVRAFIVARKHRNGCGAKGGRKVDESKTMRGKKTNASGKRA